MRLWRRRGFGRSFGYRLKFRKKRRKRSFNIWLLVLLILVTIVFTISFFERRIRPTIISMAEVKAKHIAVSAINQVIYEQINEKNIKYSDLVTFQKDNAGQITALEANIVKMNQIKSDIAIRVQQKIFNMDTNRMDVPLSAALNSELLSGWGPRIPISIIPLGAAYTDFKSSFETAGINQTKHEIFLEVKSDVRILLPMISTDSKVTTTVPVAQTIIVGTVPQHYINVKGDDHEVPLDAIFSD